MKQKSQGFSHVKFASHKIFMLLVHLHRIKHREKIVLFSATDIQKLATVVSTKQVLQMVIAISTSRGNFSTGVFLNQS